MSMYRRLLALPILFFCLAAYSRAQAQYAIPPAVACDFQKSLQYLAERGKVSFVVEGIALKPQMTPKESVSATAAGRLEPVVARLADLYGYEIYKVEGRRKHSNIFVLQKSYEVGQDIPHITSEEAAGVMADVRKLMAPWMPNPPVPNYVELVKDISKTLTPGQMARLKDGLPLSSLTQSQKNGFWRMALHLYTGMNMGDLPQPPSVVETYRLCFRKTNDGGRLARLKNPNLPTIGFEMTHPNYKMFYPWSNDFREADGDPAGKEPPLDVLWLIPDSPMEEAVARLQKRDTSLRYTLSPELRRKSVLLIAPEYASSQSLFVSLRDVYGLYMERRKGNELYLRRKRVTQVASVTQLPNALRQLIPDPLLRATIGRVERRFNFQEAQRAFKKYNDRVNDIYTKREATHEEAMAVMAKTRELQNRVETAMGAPSKVLQYVAQEGGRRLYYSATLDLKDVKDRAKGIPFPQVSERSRDLYALGQIISLVDIAQRNRGEARVFIREFDDMVLTGGDLPANTEQKNSEPSFQLFFNKRDAEGKLQLAGGLTVPKRW